MNTGMFLIIVFIIGYVFYVTKRILDIIELRIKDYKRMDRYKRSDLITEDFI